MAAEDVIIGVLQGLSSLGRASAAEEERKAKLAEEAEKAEERKLRKRISEVQLSETERKALAAPEQEKRAADAAAAAEKRAADAAAISARRESRIVAKEEAEAEKTRGMEAVTGIGTPSTAPITTATFGDIFAETEGAVSGMAPDEIRGRVATLGEPPPVEAGPPPSPFADAFAPAPVGPRTREETAIGPEEIEQKIAQKIQAPTQRTQEMVDRKIQLLGPVRPEHLAEFAFVEGSLPKNIEGSSDFVSGVSAAIKKEYIAPLATEKTAIMGKNPEEQIERAESAIRSINTHLNRLYERGLLTEETAKFLLMERGNFQSMIDAAEAAITTKKEEEAVKPIRKAEEAETEKQAAFDLRIGSLAELRNRGIGKYKDMTDDELVDEAARQTSFALKEEKAPTARITLEDKVNDLMQAAKSGGIEMDRKKATELVLKKEELAEGEIDTPVVMDDISSLDRGGIPLSSNVQGLIADLPKKSQRLVLDEAVSTANNLLMEVFPDPQKIRETGGEFGDATEDFEGLDEVLGGKLGKGQNATVARRIFDEMISSPAAQAHIQSSISALLELRLADAMKKNISAEQVEQSIRDGAFEIAQLSGFPEKVVLPIATRAAAEIIERIKSDLSGRKEERVKKSSPSTQRQEMSSTMTLGTSGLGRR